MSRETAGSTGQQTASQSATEPASQSRAGWLPSPSISYRIATVESRRSWRKVRDQDLWLALAGFGLLFLLVSVPVMYGFGSSFGADLGSGDAPTEIAFTMVPAAWLAMVAFGIMSGVGSEGEVDNQAAVLTIRPPKDVAGGLLLGTILGYTPILCLPAVTAGVGIAVGAGTPTPLAGILVASVLLLGTGVTTGFATGLVLKGVFRRSAWLSRLKPALGVSIVVVYFWLSGTGRLVSIILDIGPALRSSPLGWLGDLAFLTTPGASVSMTSAGSAVVLGVAVVPVGVFAVVRAAEYAWYAEQRQTADSDDDEQTSSRSLDGLFNSVLKTLGVSAGTRGVTTTVFTRAYRSPLQLVYLVVPLLFVLPAIESTLRSGVVPEWLPWVMLLYGAWAAGSAFPLNILGDQGATLPTLLTARVRGRQIVHGYVLAAALVFTPVTAVAGVATAQFADRSTETLLAVGLAAPVAVSAGAVLAAAIGAAFPRFQSIDLTGSTKALLPSKTAFTLFSLAATVTVTAVSVLADEIYRLVLGDLLSTYLPYGIAISPSGLETGSWLVVGTLVVVVPLAYLFASRRIDSYCLT